jgi:hypothetical protein
VVDHTPHSGWVPVVVYAPSGKWCLQCLSWRPSDAEQQALALLALHNTAAAVALTAASGTGQSSSHQAWPHGAPPGCSDTGVGAATTRLQVALAAHPAAPVPEALASLQQCCRPLRQPPQQGGRRLIAMAALLHTPGPFLPRGCMHLAALPPYTSAGAHLTASRATDKVHQPQLGLQDIVGG